MRVQITYLSIWLKIKALKCRKAWLWARLFSEGQLKERSEGDQAQWQTALGEVMAAGS
jgi:hypothetical protein